MITIRGHIAKCNEKISQLIYEYEKLEGHTDMKYGMGYGVIFLNHNLTKPMYFRFDSQTMINITFSKDSFEKEGGLIDKVDSPFEQSFDGSSNLFYFIVNETLGHISFVDFDANPIEPKFESSPVHTKNYINL